jgi:transposase
LSDDLRRRIIAARESGEVSRRFKVSRKSVERFWKQHCMTGECRPKKIGGYRRSRLQKHGATLKRWIGQQADLTLVQLRRAAGRNCRSRLD